MVSWTPLSIAGIKPRGMWPPTISSTQLQPASAWFDAASCDQPEAAGLLLVPPAPGNSTDRSRYGDAKRNLMCGNAGSLLKTLNGYLCLADCRNNGLPVSCQPSTLRVGSASAAFSRNANSFTGTALIRLNSRAIQGVGEPGTRQPQPTGNGERVARHGLELWNYYDVAGCSRPLTSVVSLPHMR